MRSNLISKPPIVSAPALIENSCSNHSSTNSRQNKVAHHD